MNNISKINFQEKKTEKPKIKSGKGSVCASLAGSLTSALPTVPAGLLVLSRFDKINKLPQDKINVIHSAYETAIKETGLGQKGIKLIKLADEEVSLLEKLKISLTPPTPQGAEEMVKKGANAFYNPGTKEILMPEKQLSTCGFHEMGHAMNANLSKWGARLQKMRLPALIIPSAIIAYCALTRNKKPDENGKISTAGKINNFIRNNGGKLAFLAMTPILLEEGMASIKGQKLANKFLKDKNLIKAVRNNNSWAYLTYLVTALALGLGAYTARKVKDNIQAKKEAQLKAAHK